MKQIGFTLFVLAILSAFTYAQRPAGVCRLENNYDREADMTTVQCDLVETVNPPIRLVVQASASFRGKEPNETGTFWFGLSAYRSGANRRTEPHFQDAATLFLSADSERLEGPVRNYRKEFFEMNRLLTEQAHAEVSRAELQKLLNAKLLSGKWGSLEFKFSATALAALKDFISRQVLVANDR
jgi:hypothetical protein